MQNASANPIPPPIPLSLSALTGVAQIPLVKVRLRRLCPGCGNSRPQVEINRGNDSDGDSPPASGGAAGAAVQPIFKLQTCNSFQAVLSDVCLTRCESQKNKQIDIVCKRPASLCIRKWSSGGAKKLNSTR
jgi:hypothetical protein